MLAINHALTGALIGLTVANPLIAIPIAIASHFICDAFPHYGKEDDIDGFLRTRRFALMLLIDALLCGVLVLILSISAPANWTIAALCAFAAAAPDFAWLPGYLRLKKGNTREKKFWFSTFASGIQWFQRPIGGVVEAAWFIGAAILLMAYL
jgi:hypothetical protein